MHVRDVLVTHCRRTGVEKSEVGPAESPGLNPWVVAALEGTGGNHEAVLSDFITGPGWVPGLKSLGARGMHQ